MLRKLLFWGLIVVSYISVIFLYDPLSIFVGPFRVSSSVTNVAMENTYQPGQYITASMYDDAVVFADGTEQKIISGDSFSNGSSWIDAAISDMWYFLFRSVRTPEISYNNVSSYYVAHVEKDSLNITRSVSHMSRDIVGIRRTLVVPNSSRILINNTKEIRDFPVAENKRYITDGIEQIVIFVPESPLALQLPLDTDVPVAFFSSDAGIVIASTIYFDNTKILPSQWHTDTQQIKLVHYEF